MNTQLLKRALKITGKKLNEVVKSAQMLRKKLSMLESSLKQLQETLNNEALTLATYRTYIPLYDFAAFCNENKKLQTMFEADINLVHQQLVAIREQIERLYREGKKYQYLLDQHTLKEEIAHSKEEIERLNEFALFLDTHHHKRI